MGDQQRDRIMRASRREFLQRSGAVLGSAAMVHRSSPEHVTQGEVPESDRLKQQDRRRELWGLLGDLPWTHRPAARRVIGRGAHAAYTL